MSELSFKRRFEATSEVTGVAPVRIAMVGDSLSTCFHVSSPPSMLLRARLTLGNWVVDNSGEIDSVFERLSRKVPVILHHFACVSSHVMFKKRSVTDRLMGIFHFCHQVERVIGLEPFPNFVLLWIGHNDLDWVERRPGHDLSQVNLDELAEDTAVAYAAQFERLLERAAHQTHPVTFIVFALVSFEQFFDARAETEAIKAKQPTRYPYLEADYRYFESMRPGRRQGMIALANAINARLQDLVNRLAPGLDRMLNVSVVFSTALNEADINRAEKLCEADAWHPSVKGHRALADKAFPVIYEQVARLRQLPPLCQTFDSPSQSPS